MNHTEGSMTSVTGTALFTQSWQPDAGARADLFLVHGLGEHSDRYAAFVAALVDDGIAVHALDHVGHGRSGGKMGAVGSVEDLAADVARLMGDVPADRPRFLFGHSLGGLIVVTCLLEQRPAVNGVILSGPLLAVGDDIPPLVQKIGDFLGRVAPGIGVLQLDSQLVSRDPAVVAAYDADPRVYHGKITAGTGRAMNRAIAAAQAGFASIEEPLLILHGGADGLTSPAGSRMLYERAGSADKIIKIYDGLYHEILNEPEQAAVRADILAWLEARLA